MQCSNNLKQIGAACLMHVDQQKHYPTGGWGWNWVGDPDRGYEKNQPGSWIYNILHGLELGYLHDMGIGSSDDTKRTVINPVVLQTPVSVVNCPSRRPLMLFAKTGGNYANADLSNVTSVARSDYGVCCGAQLCSGYVSDSGGAKGPDSYDTMPSFAWPNTEDQTDTIHYVDGVCYQRSMITNKDIRRGSSHTILAGEKYLDPDNYYDGLNPSDDQTLFTAFYYDNYRTTYTSTTLNNPMRDTRGASNKDYFGSAHPVACNFVFCDGAVHSISYDVNKTAFMQAGSRKLDSLTGLTASSAALFNE